MYLKYISIAEKLENIYKFQVGRYTDFFDRIKSRPISSLTTSQGLQDGFTVHHFRPDLVDVFTILKVQQKYVILAQYLQ